MGASGELLQVARVLKSNGTEGEVLVGFRGISPEDLDLKEPVFIVFDGLPVPFFIESFKRRGASRALLRLTGVRNLEDADEISGRDVFVRAGSIALYDDEEDGLSAGDVVGWTLLDERDVPVGVVSGYEDIPGNPCLLVDVAGGTAMVPLHEDLIVHADPEAKKIALRIPEGLL